MSVFNSAWNQMGESAAADQTRAAIEYLLRGPEQLPVEERLTHLIEGHHGRGMKGFKEALLTRVLCVVQPERFLPILVYSGDGTGKREIAEAVFGLRMPKPDQSSMHIGRLAVWSNDLLLDLVGEGFEDPPARVGLPLVGEGPADAGGHAMTADRAAIEQWENGVRGLMLGLALGESIGKGLHTHPSGIIRAGVSAQLAAFTTEGLIRAMMRMSHKGICSPPSVIWNAYRRWAKGQGIDIAPVASDAMPSAGMDGWSEGRLALRRRRGSPPSTVAALKSGMLGTPERPTSHSMGCQGLTRVMPLALMGFGGRTEQAVDLARRATALTHGSPVGLGVTAAGITVAAHCLRSARRTACTREPTRPTSSICPSQCPTEHVAVLGLDYGKGSVSRLREIAPDKTSRSALLGGMYVASTYPHAHQFTEALHFAAQAPDGDSVGAMTGALLGASHGASQLPVDLVSRHELAWVSTRWHGTRCWSGSTPRVAASTGSRATGNGGTATPAGDRAQADGASWTARADIGDSFRRRWLHTPGTVADPREVSRVDALGTSWVRRSCSGRAGRRRAGHALRVGGRERTCPSAAPAGQRDGRGPGTRR